MSRGIIYVMATAVPGLVKIGKTGTNNFEDRMYSLERNGYFNVVGLQRKFAIEVEDYDEKEALLDDIFSKSCIPGSELFALDVDLVTQLLSSFEGRQIYPKTESKEEVFDSATEQRHVKDNWSTIPNGTYHLKQRVKGIGTAIATMEVGDGSFVIKAGSTCLPVRDDAWQPEARKQAKIVDGILQEDIVCNAPSTAGWIALGRSNNGWVVWKTKEGEAIDVFREKD